MCVSAGVSKSHGSMPGQLVRGSRGYGQSTDVAFIRLGLQYMVFTTMRPWFARNWATPFGESKMKELVARDVRHLVAKLAERFRGRVIFWLLTPLWEGPKIAKCYPPMSDISFTRLIDVVNDIIRPILDAAGVTYIEGAKMARAPDLYASTVKGIYDDCVHFQAAGLEDHTLRILGAMLADPATVLYNASTTSQIQVR